MCAYILRPLTYAGEESIFQRAPVSARYQSGVHRADPVVKGGEGVISYQQDRVHSPLFTCN